MTGRLLGERPELSKLRRAAKDGRYAAVFVNRIDRISRKLAQRAVLFEEFGSLGIKIVSANEDLDDTTPEGRMMVSILGAIAEFEVERTMERTADTLKWLKDQRKPILQGLARYGYKYVKIDKLTRRREIVEAEAAIVRQIFAWCIEGHPTQWIADRLNDMGIPCPAVARGVKRDRRRHWATWMSTDDDSSPSTSLSRA